MNVMLLQIWSVMRLELKKSFFSKRNLWIYLLAAAPLAIFGLHAYDVYQRREIRAEMARQSPGVTAEKMRSIEGDMSRETVIGILGEPPQKYHFGRRNRNMERFVYSDGKSELNVTFRDNEVTSLNFREGCDFGQDITIFATVYQFFFLRLLVFFGCVFVFINLFRGELLDRSLHYYFLSPLKREVIVAGKYLAGLTATAVIFGTSIGLQFLVMNMHFQGTVVEEYMTRGHGWQHLFSYIGVTALACMGYGTLFLAAGILIRNPLIPAAIVMVWESVNGILPAVLRKFSVIYYLRALAPVEIPIGKNVPTPLAMLAMNVDAIAPWVAIVGLIAFSAVVLYYAAFRSRKLEINYGTE